MTIEKKLLGTNPVDGAVTVEDVFSTYLYEGNATNGRDIVNGIDLSGEGGLVWIKSRRGVKGANAHSLFDTERGTVKFLSTNSANAENTIATDTLVAFNSDGFTLDDDNSFVETVNVASTDYTSWTFRKAEKFFDVVTYIGSDSTRTIPHALNGPVGTIFVKCTSTNSTNWVVYHKNLLATQELYLNNTSAKSNNSRFGVAPTDTVFTVTGSDPDINGNGLTYVAYLFADNSAEDADEQMIKCGKFQVNGSYEADVTLGWEPQFVLIKPTNTSSWIMFDTMRGVPVGGDTAWLAPNLTQAEAYTANRFWPTATGFHIGNYGIPTNVDIIYMAIRAPMMKEPSAATEVFKPTSYTGAGAGTKVDNGFPADLQITNNTDSTANGSKAVFDRLRGGGRRDLLTNTTAAETNGSSYNQNFNKYSNIIESINSNGYTCNNGKPYISYAFKRAKGFFDCVAYSGTGSGGRTVNHNLGVAPEMMWVKKRSAAENWTVYHEGTHATIPGEYFLELNESSAPTGSSRAWNNVAPTYTVFTLGDDSISNGSSATYIAYLFATLAGVSKVGSYTGNGSSQTINCGFAAGARFVLIKRTDASGDWYVWDTARGIVAGNDPHLSLNTTAATVSSDDSIDPHNSGFIVNDVGATNINVSTATYVFYAIA